MLGFHHKKSDFILLVEMLVKLSRDPDGSPVGVLMTSFLLYPDLPVEMALRPLVSFKY